MTVQKGGWDYFDESFTTDNEQKTESQSGSTTTYGNYPATWYSLASGQAADAVDTTECFTAENLEMYNVHMIMATANTVEVLVSLNGTDFSVPVACMDTSNATNGTYALSLAVDTVYILRGKFASITVQNDAATQATAHMLSGVE